MTANFDMILSSNNNNLPVKMDLSTGNVSVPRISTANGKFALTIDGIAEGKPTDELEVIIVGFFNKGGETQRSYYPGKYVPGSKERPACSSDNGITPREDAQSPQSAKCATCPRNMAPKGTPRDCSFSTTLAVVLPGSDQPFSLRAPATTIFGPKKDDEDFFQLNSYKQWIASKGAQPYNLVTKLAFTRGAQKGYSFIPVRQTTPEELALAGEAIDSATFALIMREQALPQAGNAAHEGEETRDEVKTPVATTPTPAPATAGVSLADALAKLDD